MVTKKYSKTVPTYTNKEATMKLTVAFILIIGFVCWNRNWVETYHQQESSKEVSMGYFELYLRLSTDLYNETSKDENVIFSTFSAYETFYAAYLGAVGKTRQELKQFINWFMKQISTNTTALKWISITTKELDEGDGVFIQKELPIQKEYITRLQDHAMNKDIHVENVDFRGKAAIENINKFVSNATGGRIPKLYKSALDSSTQLDLLSSFNMTWAWRNVFPISKTRPGKFFTGKNYEDVDMMNDQQIVGYSDNSSLKYESILLRMQDDILLMSIVLPYKNQTLANLTRHMSPENLFNAIYQLDKGYEVLMDYKIPKMKLSSAYSLKSVLQKEGFRMFFENPDFSRITTPKKLKMSDVYHACEIEINEKGFNVSAATAIQFSKYSSKPISKMDKVAFHISAATEPISKMDKVAFHITAATDTTLSKHSSQPVTKNLQTFYADRPFLLTIIGNPLMGLITQSFVHHPTGTSS